MSYSSLGSVNLLFILSRPLFLKLKNFSTKWEYLPKTEGNHHSFNNLTVSSQYLLKLFAVLSIYLSVSAYLSVQDTTREGVLSLNAGARTLTLTNSIRIWHSVGVTKGVTSHAAHRSKEHSAGATKS